jgi:hypothetical protein
MGFGIEPGSIVSGASLTTVWNGTPSSARRATRRGEPEARTSGRFVVDIRRS